ncbi:MAG: oligosaccharide flippase family protein [Caldilineaceae bacterium]|nr:oligosaccharide flippase family protein [Caldilineaceae bacterium]
MLLNTSALAASSLWRIGLSFVLQIFIANRLGAVGLGQYTTALAYLNVCQVLGELGLPQLLVRDLARHPGHRRHYFATALLLQIGASFVVWGALSALVWFLPLQADTRLALIVITASLPMYAVSSVCAMIFQAGERMEVVMSVEMAVNTLIVGISLWILWRGGGVVQLAAVLIASQTASMALYLWILRRSALLVDGVATTVAPSMWSTMRTMLGQARPFYGLALANVLLHRLDVLLLSALAGEAITGIYSAAYLVVRILMILSQTFWQALYPTLSRLHHQAVAQYRQLTNLAVRYGLMVLLPVAALGSGAAGEILGLIFRDELYQDSVAVFRVLIWVAPAYFVASYAVNLLLIERRPMQSLGIALVHIVVTGGMLAVLATQHQALGAAWAVLLGVVLSVVVGLVLLHFAGLTLRFERWGALLAAMVILMGMDWMTANFLPKSFWVVGGIICLAGYAVVLWWGKFLSGSDLRLFQRALRR